MVGLGNQDSLHNPRKLGDSRLKRKLISRGKLLREWRMIAGHSMVSLSRELGVHWNTISNWEGGSTIPFWAIKSLVKMGWPKNQANLNMNNGR